MKERRGSSLFRSISYFVKNIRWSNCIVANQSKILGWSCLLSLDYWLSRSLKIFWMVWPCKILSKLKSGNWWVIAADWPIQPSKWLTRLWRISKKLEQMSTTDKLPNWRSNSSNSSQRIKRSMSREIWAKKS